MSYLLDIFNRRQPAPQADPTANAALLGTGSAPSQWQRPMTLPSGGPNMPQPAPEVSAPQQWNRPMTMPSGGPNTGALTPLLNVQGESAPQPAQFRHQYLAAGIQPPSMMSQLNAQNSPPPGLAGMFSGGATPPPMGAGPGWVPPAPNPGMGGVSQMPAFQPPQPMPFTNRPMPQFGAPNFSLQGGMTAAPQPSPMNGMMKGMFGVR